MLTFGPPSTRATRRPDGAFILGRCQVAWNGALVGELQRIGLEASPENPDGAHCFLVELANGNSYSSLHKEELLSYLAEVLTGPSPVLQ